MEYCSERGNNAVQNHRHGPWFCDSPQRMLLGDLEIRMECSSWGSKEQRLKSPALSPQCHRIPGVPVGETAEQILGNAAS